MESSNSTLVSTVPNREEMLHESFVVAAAGAEGAILGAYCPRTEPSGEVLARRSLPGFTLTETRYTPGLTLNRHVHENAYFTYVLEGSYQESCNGVDFACTPRTLRFLPAGEAHSNFYESGARCLLVQIEPQMLARLRDHGPVLDSPGEIQGTASAWLAERLYTEFQGQDGVSTLSMEGILLELLAEGARSTSRDAAPDAPRWLRRAREMMETRFLESLSLSEIAAVAGVHRVHLSREFRRHYQTTVGDFLRQRRIEHACRLLTHSDSSIAQIALTCGFSDQSHFSATFKRQVGVTPAKFRELNAKA